MPEFIYALISYTLCSFSFTCWVMTLILRYLEEAELKKQQRTGKDHYRCSSLSDRQHHVIKLYCLQQKCITINYKSQDYLYIAHGWTCCFKLLKLKKLCVQYYIIEFISASVRLYSSTCCTYWLVMFGL